LTISSGGFAVAVPSAAEIQRQTEIHSGLAVVIGSSLDYAANLAAPGRMQVHLLVPSGESDAVHAVRGTVLERNLGGRVIVARLPHTGRLPHPDRFVNLLIADRDALGEDAPALAELLRVLALRGAAYLRNDGQWRVHRPPQNPQLDGWFSHWYDASGNCVSRDRVAGFPRTAQWRHGPAMEDGTADGKIVRVADGRALFVDQGGGDLICRDAGNGSLLWRRSVGLDQRNDISIAAGRVHLWYDPEQAPSDPKRRQARGPLTAFDPATGETAQVYEKGLRAGTAKGIETPWMGRTRTLTPEPWFVVTDEHVVQAYGPDLVVLDRRTGERRWSHKIEDATWFSPIISDEMVLAAEAEYPGRSQRNNGSDYVRAVTAYRLQDGERVWRNTQVHPEREVQDAKNTWLYARSSFKTMSAADRLLLLHISSYQFRTGGAVAVLDIRSGEERWRREFAAGELYTQGSQRPVIRNGEVIMLDGTGAYRFDANTGEPLGEPITRPREMKRSGRVNGACTGSRATVEWLMANGWLYVGPDGEPKVNQAARGGCGQGVVPAHGLVFVAPTACDCGDYLRGYLALSPESGGAAIPENTRLTSGVPTPESDSFDAPWSIFLGNPQRTSHATSGISESLAPVWSARAVQPRDDPLRRDRRESEYDIGELTAPVVGGGCVVVAAPETHQVIAVEEASGNVRWRFPAGGKVDTPPTLARGMAIFGCDDGAVYAVRLTDGKLVWRFRVAPTDLLAMSHGHLGSAFPTPGSVLKLGDRVIAVAGQHTDLGGLRVWSLDLATGAAQAYRVLSTDAPPALCSNLTVADADGGGFWVASPPGGSYGAGGGYHLTPDLEDAPSEAAQPPALIFDRQGDRVRFRTDAGRGGSTHGWKGAMRATAFHRLQGHRIAVAEDTGYGLLDPTGRGRSVVWATRRGKDVNPIWELDREALDDVQSLGALAVTAEHVVVGGGARDGSAGQVFLLDAKTGRLVRKWRLPARVTECGVAIAGGGLFISCEDGSLHRFGD
jgi:outer membrane protein assembly factor BamB